MANFEIVALDPATPQLRAPGAADAYSLPRHIAGANITLNQLAVTGAATLDATHNGYIISVTNTTNITLPLTSSVPSGYNVIIKNNNTSGSSAVTVLRQSPNTIYGLANFVLRPQEYMQFISDGSNWILGSGTPYYMSVEGASGEARPTASGTAAVAIGRSSSAGSSNAVAIGASAYSGGINSFAAGGSTYAVYNYSVAIGATSGGGAAQAWNTAAITINGYTSGNNGLTLNTDTTSSTYGAAGTRSTAIAYFARAAASQSIALGHYSYASGINAIAIGGSYVVSGAAAQAVNAIAIGDGALADGQRSVAIGTSSEAQVHGKFAFASHSFAGVRGDSQYGKYILRGSNSTNSFFTLTTDLATASSNNQVVLSKTHTSYAFRGIITARSTTAAGYFAAWEVKGLITRGSTSGSTVLQASSITVIHNPGALMSISLNADTTYGALNVSGSGVSGFLLRWVAVIDTVELAYS